MFGFRPDGRRVSSIDPIVGITPYLMPMRCDAQVFLHEFMQAETNFEAFRDFQSSSAVFTNWKSDIMVYNEEVFDGFVRESTRFTSWDEMVRTAADRAFSDKKE